MAMQQLSNLLCLDQTGPRRQSYPRNIDLDWASRTELDQAIKDAIKSLERIEAATAFKIWDSFILFFRQWHLNHLRQAPDKALQNLRDFLRTNGVYCELHQAPAQALFNVLSSPDEPLPWQSLEKHGDSQIESGQSRDETVEIGSSSGHPPISMDLLKKMGWIQRHFAKSLMFSGKDGEFLRITLIAFAEICWRYDFPEEELARVFVIMLTGEAHLHYLYCCANRGMTYQQMCLVFRDRYASMVFECRYEQIWSNLHISQIVAENPQKSLSECLDLLSCKINRLATGIISPQSCFFSNALRRDKLRLAVRGVPECVPALFNPRTTYEAFLQELHLAIELDDKSRTTEVAQIKRGK